MSRRSPNGPWTCLQSMPWSRETVSGRTLGSYLPSAIRGLSFPRAMGARRCRRSRDSTIHSWSPRTHSASATREWWRPTKPLGGCTVANCPRWSADSRNSSARPDRVQAEIAGFTGFEIKGQFADFHRGDIPRPCSDSSTGCARTMPVAWAIGTMTGALRRGSSAVPLGATPIRGAPGLGLRNRCGVV